MENHSRNHLLNDKQLLRDKIILKLEEYVLPYTDINVNSHHIKQEKSLHFLFAALHIRNVREQQAI